MLAWKKWCVCLVMACYMGFLSWGTLAHAFKIGTDGNTISYWAVWDMFCGWSAWDNRTHIIAKGASGKFYEVKEPWGEFHPFGNLSRIHYDHTNHLLPKHIRHILSRTEHESIDQVYVVEEVWPKQYNMPPRLYAHYFDRENDKQSYFNLRAVCQEDGNVVAVYPTWDAKQRLSSIYDNPRLRQQASRATSIYSPLFTPNSGRQQSFSPLSLSGPINTN